MSQPAAGVTVRPTGSVVLVSLGVVVAVVLFTGQWLAVMDPLDAVLALTTVVLASVGFASGFTPHVRPARTVAFGFALSYLGIAPIYQLGTSTAAWSDSGLYAERPQQTTIALALTAGALGALLLGTWIGDRRAADDHASPGEVEVRLPVAWGCLGLAVLITPLAIRAAGGLAGMFVNRTERIEFLIANSLPLDATSGPIYAFLTQLPAGLSLAATYLFTLNLASTVRRRGWGSLDSATVVGWAVSVATVTLYVNPLANTRFLFVMAVGSVAMVALRPRTRRAGAVIAALTIFGTLIAYPLANVFRTDDFTMSSSVEVLGSADFDGFQQVVNSVVYVEDEGHTHGHFISSAIAFAVPRAIWPGKAEPAADVVAGHRGYLFTSLSEPLHAESYVDLGPVGMALVMGLLGGVIGRVDGAWAVGAATRWAAMAPCVALASLGFLRGPLAGLVPFIAPFLVLTFVGLRARADARSVAD